MYEHFQLHGVQAPFCDVLAIFVLHLILKEGFENAKDKTLL